MTTEIKDIMGLISASSTAVDQIFGTFRHNRCQTRACVLIRDDA